MSLAKKTLSGFIWTFTSRVGTRVTVLFFGVILARLLTPEDFGLIAMVTIFFALSENLVNSGFLQALVRQKTIEQQDKSTVFYVNIIISVLLYIVIWFAAPLIADFFNQQQLIVIVRLMGLDIIFMGLIIVQRAVLLQSLNFKKLSYIEITSEILSGLIGIYLAFTGHGVISLAIKFFLRSFFTSAFLWITNPWKPIGFINKDSFNSLFKFGSNLMFTSFLNSGFNNLFDVIIGKFYSPALLGFYNRANVFTSQTVSSVQSSLELVTYPVLSKVKDDNSRLKNAQEKILVTISFVNIPMIIILALAAKPLVITLLGINWVQMVPFMQLLCVESLIAHVVRINRNLLMVKGRSDWYFKLNLWENLIITIAIITGLPFGIWGLIIAKVLSRYIIIIVSVSYANKLISFSLKEQVKLLNKIMALAIPMVLILLFINSLSIDNSIIHLLIMIFSGILVYISTSYFIKADAFYLLLELLNIRKFAAKTAK